jgi:hypothetical protein
LVNRLKVVDDATALPGLEVKAADGSAMVIGVRLEAVDILSQFVKIVPIGVGIERCHHEEARCGVTRESASELQARPGHRHLHAVVVPQCRNTNIAKLVHPNSCRTIRALD